MHFALKFLETILQSTNFFSMIDPVPPSPKPAAVTITSNYKPQPPPPSPKPPAVTITPTYEPQPPPPSPKPPAVTITPTYEPQPPPPILDKVVKNYDAKSSTCLVDKISQKLN